MDYQVGQQQKEGWRGQESVSSVGRNGGREKKIKFHFLEEQMIRHEEKMLIGLENCRDFTDHLVQSLPHIEKEIKVDSQKATFPRVIMSGS